MERADNGNNQSLKNQIAGKQTSDMKNDPDVIEKTGSAIGVHLEVAVIPDLTKAI